MSDLVTGEAVALDLRIAQLPARLGAALIDLTIMVVLYLVLGLIGGVTLTGVTDEALAAALSVLLVVGVFLGYPVIMESLTRGRTVGKIAFGVRVIRIDGGPITFRHALVRGLVGLILERPGFALAGFGPGLGIVVSTLSKNGRRIGDMAAGTMVLQERVSARPLWIPWMPAPLAAWAGTLDLTGFDDGLALQVRQFLGRAQQFYPVAREELGHRLAGEVRQRTTPDPPAGTPGWAYLSAVLAERRHREETRAAAAAGRPALPIPTWPPRWPPAPPYAGGPPGPVPPAPPYAGGPPGPVPPPYPTTQPPYASGPPGSWPGVHSTPGPVPSPHPGAPRPDPPSALDQAGAPAAAALDGATPRMGAARANAMRPANPAADNPPETAPDARGNGFAPPA